MEMLDQEGFKIVPEAYSRCASKPGCGAQPIAGEDVTELTVMGEQLCSQSSGDRVRIPRILIMHHGIDGSQGFSHDRSERDFERLADADQANETRQRLRDRHLAAHAA